MNGEADADDYEEVEWEDAFVEGTVADGESALAGASGQGILIELETGDGGKRRVKRVAISKEYRQLCQGLHRVHLLCLLARARLHDEAASVPELQARMLSMLPSELLPAPPSTASKSILPTLRLQLDWFKSSFSLMSHLDDDPSSLSALTDRALQLKAGPAELLVLLFIALLRAQGLLVRFVSLLDALALEPWRRAAPRPVRVLTAREARDKEEAHARKQALEQQGEMKRKGKGSKGGGEDGSGDEAGGGRKGRRKPAGGDDELDDEVEEAVRVLLNGVDSRSYGFKNLMRDLIEQLPDVTFSKPVQKSIQKLMAQILAPDSEAPHPQAGTKRGRAKAGSAGAAKRGRRSGEAAGAEGLEGTAAGPGQQQQPASGSGAAGSAAPGQRLNRGEEEFDRELQVALMATAAEAEARERRKLTGSDAGPGPSSGSNPGQGPKAKGVRAQLFRRTGSKASGRGESARDASAGLVRGSRGGLVPTVWAEVYVGSAETGRWVHVDVLNGLVDKPDSVEAATQRSSPAAYIVACCPGAQGRSPEEASSSSSSRQAANGSSSSPRPSDSTPSAQEVKDVTTRYISSLLGLNKIRDGVWWDATLARLFGPPAAAAAGPGPSQAGPSPGHAAAPVAAPGSEALRSKREDAELHQRASSQLQGLPASIDGFKNHPVYVLKRHITKYEALRPGTALLGTHRGEPFYARAAVSVLHTAERWRREGKEVRADELDKPFKLVAKRKQPPPPGSGSGGYAFGKWGRGAASGARSSKRSKVEEDDPMGEEGDLGEEGAASPGEAPTVKLYGAWQTEPWRRPRAEGGIVPKNERGNVDCPPLVLDLPIGTVHLQYVGIGGVCRSLGVDFAPALVGFEVQAGRMLPKLDGVVVCEEFEHKVVAAYLERETAKQEVLAARRRREAVAAWALLLQAMRTRLQLKSSYEGAAVAPGRAAPRAGGSADVVDLTDDDHRERVERASEVKLRQLRDKYEQQQQRPAAAAAAAAAAGRGGARGAQQSEQPGLEVEEI